MGFVGVYRAIYDYEAQAPGELTIAEGDLLFVIEKSTGDDWWKAKKKAIGDEEEEPEGLIPNNYIEEVHIHPEHATSEAQLIHTRPPLKHTREHFTSIKDRRMRN